jgi:serologically defined colon cancer antigen 8
MATPGSWAFNVNKKIAQLTRVIFRLHSSHVEHERQMQFLRDQWDQEVREVAEEAKAVYEQRFKEREQSLISEYEKRVQDVKAEYKVKETRCMAVFTATATTVQALTEEVELLTQKVASSSSSWESDLAKARRQCKKKVKKLSDAYKQKLAGNWSDTGDLPETESAVGDRIDALEDRLEQMSTENSELLQAHKSLQAELAAEKSSHEREIATRTDRIKALEAELAARTSETEGLNSKLACFEHANALLHANLARLEKGTTELQRQRMIEARQLNERHAAELAKIRGEEPSRSLQLLAEIDALREMESTHKRESEQATSHMQSQMVQIAGLRMENDKLRVSLAEAYARVGRNRENAVPDRVRSSRGQRDERTEHGYPPPNRLAIDLSALGRPVRPLDAEPGIPTALSRTEMVFRMEGKNGNWILPPLDDERKRPDRIVSSRREKRIGIDA